MYINTSKEIYNISKIKLIFMLAYLLIIINLVGHCLYFEKLNLIISIIIVIIPGFLKLTYIYEYIYMCLPFFNVLNKSVGDTSLFYIIILIYILKYFINKGEKYKLKSKLLILMGVTILTFYNINTGSKYISWLILLIPLILSYKEEKLFEKIKNIILLYSFSMILSSVCGYYMLINNLSIYTGSYIWNDGEIYFRFSGLIGDSNVYSQCILIIIASLLIIYEMNKEKIVFVMIFLLFAFGLLTYSKMNIIMMLVIFIYYSIHKSYKYIKDKNKTINFIVFMLTICILISIGIYIFMKNIDSKIISSYIVRFNAKDLLTGRMYVYDRFISMWKEDYLKTLVAGIGFSKYIVPYRLSEALTIIYSHNIYIETISLFGVLGMYIIFIFLFYRISRFFKYKKDKIFLLPLLILLITGLALHGHLEFNYYFNVILAITFLEYNEQKIKRGENYIWNQ